MRSHRKKFAKRSIRSQLMDFRPVPTIALQHLFGISIMANIPLELVHTPIFCCYWICLIQIDLYDKPRGKSMTDWRVLDDKQPILGLIDPVVQSSQSCSRRNNFIGSFQIPESCWLSLSSTFLSWNWSKVGNVIQ